MAIFMASPAEFRAWLEEHYAEARELWVGFRKKGSGSPSITWPEAVDEALCFGWIDGIRKSIDDTSYTIRFTPRKRGSIWSDVNTARVHELTKLGRMHPAGLEAFAKRDAKRAGVYSYERRNAQLDPAYEQRLKANEKAWELFSARPPWYRRAAVSWVMSAKQEATRLRRLARLVEDSENGRT